VDDYISASITLARRLAERRAAISICSRCACSLRRCYLSRSCKPSNSARINGSSATSCCPTEYKLASATPPANMPDTTGYFSNTRCMRSTKAINFVHQYLGKRFCRVAELIKTLQQVYTVLFDLFIALYCTYGSIPNAAPSGIRPRRESIARFAT